MSGWRLAGGGGGRAAHRVWGAGTLSARRRHRGASTRATRLRRPSRRTALACAHCTAYFTSVDVARSEASHASSLRAATLLGLIGLSFPLQYVLSLLITHLYDSATHRLCCSPVRRRHLWNVNCDLLGGRLRCTVTRCDNCLAIRSMSCALLCRTDIRSRCRCRCQRRAP